MVQSISVNTVPYYTLKIFLRRDIISEDKLVKQNIAELRGEKRWGSCHELALKGSIDWSIQCTHVYWTPAVCWEPFKVREIKQ